MFPCVSGNTKIKDKFQRKTGDMHEKNHRNLRTDHRIIGIGSSDYPRLAADIRRACLVAVEIINMSGIADFAANTQSAVAWLRISSDSSCIFSAASHASKKQWRGKRRWNLPRIPSGKSGKPMTVWPTKPGGSWRWHTSLWGKSSMLLIPQKSRKIWCSSALLALWMWEIDGNPENHFIGLGTVFQFRSDQSDHGTIESGGIRIVLCEYRSKHVYTSRKIKDTNKGPEREHRPCRQNQQRSFCPERHHQSYCESLYGKCVGFFRENAISIPSIEEAIDEAGQKTQAERGTDIGNVRKSILISSGLLALFIASGGSHGISLLPMETVWFS